mmetsp:Transcript_2477/g.4750  ORF Transcript_2477/g.4750 Transcript_2477/m.4750 type:complete len:82 (-) Transcript_2477:76-321(-)
METISVMDRDPVADETRGIRRGIEGEEAAGDEIGDDGGRRRVLWWPREQDELHCRRSIEEVVVKRETEGSAVNDGQGVGWA